MADVWVTYDTEEARVVAVAATDELAKAAAEDDAGMEDGPVWVSENGGFRDTHWGYWVRPFEVIQ